MTAQQIKGLAHSLNIPHLVHFTRIANLESIMESGIYPVARFDEIDVCPEINDHLRLDGQHGGVSISIAFPNSQMFYKLRQENEGANWAILLLRSSILWTKDCAFCKHNAADARIANQCLAALKTSEAFAGMFEEIDGYPTRIDQRLKPSDPTDVQAEILVFDTIESQLIAGVIFDSREMKDSYLSVIGERKSMVHPRNKGLFAARTYARRSA